MPKPQRDNAYGIALVGLRSCYSKDGILAGSHHFTDLWARDSLFASLGALTAGDFDAVRKTISMFLGFQRPDGSIPYRILRSPTTIGKYFGHPRYFVTPRPNFRSHQSGGFVPDGGLMTIIACQAYVCMSGDREYLATHYPSLCRAAEFYDRIFRGGLVREWFLCEWADGVMKCGNTLYTNILYWKALDAMHDLARRSRDASGVAIWETRRDSIAGLIRQAFWNGEYFADWVDWVWRDYCSSHGNSLAVLFGFTKRNETGSVLHSIITRCDAGWTLKNSDRKYPSWRVPVSHYLIGMQDYHNGCLWMQPGLVAILALWVSGRKAESRRRFERMGEKILSDMGIYEVYEPTGEPVRRLFYRSEHPFAWSSGLYVLAHHVLTGAQTIPV